MLKNNTIKKLAIVKVVALASFASALSAGGLNPSISLEQTVGTDLLPYACGTEYVISVDAGTPVNFCYTVTNTGSDLISLHDLDTSAYGSLFTGVPQDLLPTETFTFNDVRTVSSNVINEATWVASTLSYNVTTIPFVFDDISLTGLPLGITEDEATNLVMPFAFSLFGNSSTDLRVGNNGAVLIGDTTSSISWNNQPLPVAALPLIAPLWDDHSVFTGEIFYEVLGAAPNQIVIVQWNDMNHYDSDLDETVTFQLALFEGSNEIQFRYLDLVYDNSGDLDYGVSATIGLNQGDGITSYTYPDSLVDALSISLIPAATSNVSDTSIAAVSVLTPQVAVNPGAFDIKVSDIDVMASDILVVSNDGQGSLEWSVDEASAPAALPRPFNNYMPELQANQSIGPAPISATKSTAKNESNKLLLGSGITAYGNDLLNNLFGSFDITNPFIFNTISSITEQFYAGDLVDGLTTMYGINNNDSNLYSINVADGVTTMIGPSTPNPGQSWTGISEDPTTGVVYASATNCSNGTLYIIDISTGAATEVGPMTNTPCAIDIAVSASGQMYTHDIVTDSIVAIDKSTGEGTVIGLTGFDANYAQGMDFDTNSNTLYLAAYNSNSGAEIRTVDLQTGATTLVDITDGEIGAFGIATHGNSCLHPEDISWLSMTNTSGVVGSNDTDEVIVDFDATGLAVGTYEAKICVFTNDMDEPLVAVPVTLEVSDLIYANGFEAPAP